MKNIKQAIAGTLESSDLLVKVEPNEQQSGYRDSKRGHQAIRQTNQARGRRDFGQAGVDRGTVVIEDKGALDYAIRARVQAAVLRAAGSEELNWEQLS